MANVVYTAIFFEEEKLKKMFKPVHPNLFYHHSTIGFGNDSLIDLPINKKVKIRIIGRLTTKKVDVILVDNSYSQNKFPHITLSTANGIKPQESNDEIENNQDKIGYLKSKNIFIWGRIGYYNDNKEIIMKEESKISKIIIEEANKIFTEKQIINTIDFSIKGDKRNGISFNREIYDYDNKNNKQKITYIDINKNNSKPLSEGIIPIISFEILSYPNNNKIEKIAINQNNENGLYRYINGEYMMIFSFDGDFYTSLEEFIIKMYIFSEKRVEYKQNYEKQIQPLENNKIPIPTGFISIINDILKKQRNNYVSRIVSNIEKNNYNGTQRQYDFLKRFRSGEIKQTDYSSKN